MGRIIVIGSASTDYTACVKSLPRPGETVGGAQFLQANGGKGANQAVTAARLGADVTFVVCLGTDAAGERLKAAYAADGVDVSKIKFSSDNPTGTALIFVDAKAENAIAVAPGSNFDLLPADIEALEADIAQAEYVLLQLEIPVPTVMKAVEVARRHSVKVVLNPAPMCELPQEIYGMLDLITPNETEAEAITGIHIETVDDAVKAARVIRSKGVRSVIITLGDKGSLIDVDGATDFVPARKVDAKDTTGAGDVYNGALLTALCEGMSLKEAAYFATCSSSISVTRSGAQSSIPDRKEVDAIM